MLNRLIRFPNKQLLNLPKFNFSTSNVTLNESTERIFSLNPRYEIKKLVQVFIYF